MPEEPEVPADAPSTSPMSPGTPDEPAPRRAIPAAETATAAARPKRRHVGRWLAAAVMVLVLALIGGLLFVRGQLGSVIHQFGRQQLMPSEAGRPTAPPPDGPMTFLIAGTDSRDPKADPGNSDTLMIGYIPKNRQHVYLISIPRDLWVKQHGSSGFSKINSAYADGGAPQTILTLEDMFGVRLQHAAIMNFWGFMQMVDTVGGVDVYNPYETESVGNVYPAGMIHLNGDQAINYVRERHELENGDLDRTGRQRAVIKAIAKKAMSAGVLTNPTKTQEFMKQLSACVTLDDQFSDKAVEDLVWSMKLGSSDDIRTVMLPIAGYATAWNGEDVDAPDPAQIAQLSAAMKQDTMDTWWTAHENAPLITDNWGRDTWSSPYVVDSPTAGPSASTRPSPSGRTTTGPATHPSARATRVTNHGTQPTQPVASATR